MKSIICSFLGHKWEYSIQNEILNGAQKDCLHCGESIFRDLDTGRSVSTKKKRHIFFIKILLFISSPLWIIPFLFLGSLSWIARKIWEIVNKWTE